jgi:hypothetical protein
MLPTYYIHYENKGASSVSHVDSYIIMSKLLDSVCNIHVLLLFIHSWKIRTYLYRTFILQGCLHKLWHTLIHGGGIYHWIISCSPFPLSKHVSSVFIEIFGAIHTFLVCSVRILHTPTSWPCFKIFLIASVKLF